MENSKRIIIIDGNSLINRAFYAMQRPMVTKDGFFTQGIYGFVNLLTKIKKEYPSGYMVCAFDLKAPTFRHNEYKEYKAGRKKMPPELAMEIPVLKELLDAMNIKRIELEGYEADDLIGTVSLRAEEEGLEPLIITGDRDEFQLASDITKVLFTKKGVSEFDLYDRNAFIEEYGFTPEQFVDYKGLMGDPSDNIPGLPGVGKKTAEKLINEYGSVAELLERVDELPAGKLKTNIEENYELAVLSRRLALICRTAPIDIDWEDYRLAEPDYPHLVELYKRLEFNSFLKKLKIPEDCSINCDAEGGEDALEKPEPAALKVSYINDSDELTAILKRLSEKGETVPVKLLSDRNHRAKPAVFGLGFADGDTCCYIQDEELIRIFAGFAAEGLPLGGHFLQDDIYALMAYVKDDTRCEFRASYDTAICQYVLDSGRSGYSIKALSLDVLGRDIEDEDEVLASTMQLELFSDNSAKYSQFIRTFLEAVIDLNGILDPRLSGERRVYEEIELPLIPVLAEMERNGFGIDTDTLKEQGAELSAEIERLTAEIHSLAGHEFNINSPQQLGTVLFEELELPSGKKTKKGYSTAADILEKIRDEHEIVPLVLEYRTISKLKGTYVDGMLPLIGEDGRIHAHFRQTVAATGRLSCTEPNLQNIPIRQEYGRRLRKAFVPCAACTLTGADYSQIELRVLAAMSADPELTGAFISGTDIHRLTASKVLGIPEDQITPSQRSAAKAVNFGVIYGMSGFGLAEELSITRNEAEKYIRDYFSKYTAVGDFMDEQKRLCREKGYVETLYGRKRFVNEISASAYMVRQLGERLAMNSPIQGTAADIIKLAMIKVHRALNQGGFRSRLVLQIHDELIIETAAGEEEAVAALLKENMETAAELSVPITAQVSTGDNWYQLK